MNLKYIKNKEARVKAIIEFILSDEHLSTFLKRVEEVNIYSYRIELMKSGRTIMLYPTSLKIFDPLDKSGTFTFSTLKDLKAYLLTREEIGEQIDE